ncbi:hypothetical protein ACIQGZ_17160 [Streptomyces sp. NPDC092296]|uniref:hypothetical protein n=1 Tax=Streptomyces sp. NPDC092296 TaxID=3366012 RepID=UPI00382A195B
MTTPEPTTPALTRAELQDLLDDASYDAYRYGDRIAFVREQCDAHDRVGGPLTTAMVRAWLDYTGCAHAESLPTPSQMQARIRELEAELAQLHAERNGQ